MTRSSSAPPPPQPPAPGRPAAPVADEQDRPGPAAAGGEALVRLSKFHDFYGALRNEEEPARRVSWRSIWDQELRFEVLCEIFDRVPPEEPFSVLDVGCGLGELVGYLRRRGDDCRYLGIDLLPEMVEEARRRHPGERFEIVDLLHQDPPGAPFDFVLASGLLSVKVSDHERYVHRLIERMLSLARCGVAFNVQSIRTASRNLVAQLQSEIWYADPIALYNACRKLTPRIVLREDFLSTDFALFLYPGPGRSHRGYASFLAADPPRPDRAVGMAYLLLDEQLPAEALESLAGAEDSAEVLNYRGLCHLHLGQPERALAPLRSSLACDPLQLNAPVNLGVALTMLGREEEALQVWEEALRQRPDNQSVRVKLAHALLAAGRASEAEAVAAGLTDDGLRDDLLGLALAQQGRLEEARALLERVAERNPTMARVRHELAGLLERLGDEPAAARRYLQALLLHPEHAGARKALRRLALLHRGQGSGAAAPLRQAIAEFAGQVELVGALLAELDRES